MNRNCQISYGTSGDRAFFQIEGQATQVLGQALRQLSSKLMEEGRRHFEFHLSKCASMDSTVIGILVQIALGLKKWGLGGGVALFDVNPYLRDTLDTLGVSPLISFPESADEDEIKHIQFHPLVPSQSGKRDWANAILGAHEALTSIDQRNRLRFEDVIHMIDQELSHFRA